MQIKAHHCDILKSGEGKTVLEQGGKRGKEREKDFHIKKQESESQSIWSIASYPES